MTPKSRIRLLLESLLRVILFTIVGTLLCFAVGLLIGILGTSIYSLIRHIHADMSVAYRNVAAPAAVGGGSAALLGMIVYEIKRAKQSEDRGHSNPGSHPVF